MPNNIYSSITQVPVNGGYRSDQHWVWGSTVAKGDDGLYHMFVSRWTNRKPFFTTWITDCEIAHCTSESLTGPYTFRDVALGKRGAEFWDGQSCHNPKIVRHKDKWYLFYMGSTHPFEPFPDGTDPDRQGKHCIVARSNKRVGVAMADSPYGPWTRLDEPALKTKPLTYYSFLTSNPSPIIHEDGSVLLMFKARAYVGDTHGPQTIGLAKANAPLGPYEVIAAEPIFGPDKMGEIEDPSLWMDDDGYHMLAKDMKDAICGEHHAGILCHSTNGVDWEIDPDPKAYSKTIAWDDGREEFLGHMERAFPYVEDGEVKAITFAVMDGKGGFDNGQNSYNIVVPLS